MFSPIICDEKKCSKYDIVYLDNSNEKNVSEIRLIEEKINLDENKDAYVLNKNSFIQIESECFEKYLANGGIIIVNDKSVTSQVLKSKIKCNVCDFDYSANEYYYGFCVFKRLNENYVVNISVDGFKDDDLFDFVYNEENRVSIAEDVTSYAIEMLSNDSNIDQETGGDIGTGGGSQNPENTCGKIIAYASIYNIIYNENEKAYSYTITTEITSVMKVENNDKLVQGVYDVVTSFIVDGEEDYKITSYSVRKKSTSTVIDASYLESNVETSFTFGTTAGFSGNVIEGGYSCGVTYTYNNTSQTIVNDFPAGNIKYWDITPAVHEYGASRKIVPSIRVINNNDAYYTYAYARFESITVKKKRLFTDKTIDYKPENRIELVICWNSYGFIAQNTITG